MKEILIFGRKVVSEIKNISTCVQLLKALSASIAVDQAALEDLLVRMRKGTDKRNKFAHNSYSAEETPDGLKLVLFDSLAFSREQFAFVTKLEVPKQKHMTKFSLDELKALAVIVTN